MDSVGIEPNSRVAQFQFSPVGPGRASLDLVLTGPGYRSLTHVPHVSPGGNVTIPVNPPPRSLIGRACFVNRGPAPVLLTGTTEPRTVSRPTTTIAGKRELGDITLAFGDGRQRSLLRRAGTVFAHASVLTDHLVPVWMIWIVAVLAALGLPAGIVAALYLALREDELAGF
jgi:hypothetical protein